MIKKYRKEKYKFPRTGDFHVYILECSDGTYYNGYTPDLKRRVELHSKGRGAKYTRTRRPVELIWSKRYRYFKNAFLEEKRIKSLTRRQKEKLVKASPQL
jgi:putative endonuclease